MSKPNSDFDIVEDEAPGLGHNNPPSEMEIAEQSCDTAAAPLIKDRDKDLKKPIEDWKKRTSIADKEMAEKAAEFLKSVAGHGKKFEALRTEKKGFYDKIAGAIQTKFKGYVSEMTETGASVRKMLEAYLTEENRKAELQAAADLKAQQDAAALAAAESPDSGQTPDMSEVVHVSAPAPVALKTSSGTNASSKKSWDFKVTDVSKLKPPYVIANEAVLRALCQSSKEKPELEGVDFFIKTSVRIS